jgi:hypothetical protein
MTQQNPYQMSLKKQKKNSINAGHYLELMDRIHIVCCTIDDHILNHPLSENEKDIQDKIDSALELLLEAYQMVGNKEIGYEDENNTY